MSLLCQVRNGNMELTYFEPTCALVPQIDTAIITGFFIIYFRRHCCVMEHSFNPSLKRQSSPVDKYRVSYHASGKVTLL